MALGVRKYFMNVMSCGNVTRRSYHVRERELVCSLRVYFDVQCEAYVFT